MISMFRKIATVTVLSEVEAKAILSKLDIEFQDGQKYEVMTCSDGSKSLYVVGDDFALGYQDPETDNWKYLGSPPDSW